MMQDWLALVMVDGAEPLDGWGTQVVRQPRVQCGWRCSTDVANWYTQGTRTARALLTLP